MKQFFGICLLLFFVSTTNSWAQPTAFPVDSIGYLSETIVKIQAFAGTWVFIPTGEPNRRFLPEHLGTQYKQDGLLVKISGVIGRIPPNIRMVGTPFEIRSIGVAKKKKPTKADQPILLPPSIHPKNDKLPARPNKKKVNSQRPAPPTDGKRPMIWTIKHKKGVITYNKLEGGFYSIKIDGKTYVVENLPKEFQQDGLRVIVSGKADNDRPNIFMFGPILTIEKIESHKNKREKKRRHKQRSKKYHKSTGQIDNARPIAPFICGTTH